MKANKDGKNFNYIIVLLKREASESQVPWETRQLTCIPAQRK